MNNKDIIFNNPLQNIIKISKSNPKWCCTHLCAVIVDYKREYYRCEICSKNGKIIRQIRKEELCKNIQNAINTKK